MAEGAIPFQQAVSSYLDVQQAQDRATRSKRKPKTCKTQPTRTDTVNASGGQAAGQAGQDRGWASSEG